MPQEKNDNKPLIIESKKILIVEGDDEINFFKALFKHLNINDVQIINFEGKENYSKEFQTLVILPNFKSVIILGIIKDADNSFPNTEKSIKDLLGKCKLTIPDKSNSFKENNELKVGYYIMPNNQESGMLESLCLNTVSDHPIIQCVNNFYDCVKIKNDKINEYKSKAQAFLAGINPKVKSIGVGALNHFWNFNHGSMNELKIFLNNFK